MTKEASGIIESSRKDRKGIKVDGVWYTSWSPINANWKDSVTFQYKEVPNKVEGQPPYLNIVGEVVVNGSGTGGAPTAGAGAASQTPKNGFPVPRHERERSIIRRHAFSAAVELEKNRGGCNEFEDVRDLAIQIENWTSGDDIATLKKKLEEEGVEGDSSSD